MFLLHLLACLDAAPDGSAETGTAASACLDDGGGTPDESADDLAALRADCEADGGTGCDPAAYLGADAATCLAAEYGLPNGLEGYTADLLYHYGQKTGCWSVSSLDHVDADGNEGGQVFLIDATTGALLAEEGWDGVSCGDGS